MKLKAAARNKLPASDFAGPDRSYPVEDAGHAKAAKSFAGRAEKAGRMSKGEEAKIDAKADRVLGERDGNGAATAANQATNRGGSHGKGGIASHPNMSDMHDDKTMRHGKW